jgi:predicted TIM-barrel fold metal-dependent hydrolase
LLDEFRELPIPADVMELWLHGNAERLLGVPVAA